MNFLQKIAKKNGVIRIVMIGDSIGDGCGADKTETKWLFLLVERIRKELSCKVTVTNLAVGGTDSFFGYNRLMQLEDTDYDLAFVCEGQNDAESSFEFYYEVLLRNIRSKWKNCAVVTMLESSQREYTPKIKTIISLSQKYKCSICDTIKAFADSGKTYEELCNDGIHPNNAGHELYYKAAYCTVSENLQLIGDMPKPDDGVAVFGDYKFLPKASVQLGLGEYGFVTDAEFISADFLMAPCGASFSLYLNGIKTDSVGFKHEHPWAWERLLLKKCVGKTEIRLILDDETDIALFLGFAVIGGKK